MEELLDEMKPKVFDKSEIEFDKKSELIALFGALCFSENRYNAKSSKIRFWLPACKIRNVKCDFIWKIMTAVSVGRWFFIEKNQ